MSLDLDKYQEFATLLEQLRSDVTKTQLDAPILRQRLSKLQQWFVQEIVPICDLDWREQSYQTEMSKQLRLLEIDVMFFQGARQSATAQARLKAIGDRLTTLLQYCSAILQPEIRNPEK
ncbi:heterocyst frequency control protein PatD [Sphaerospermopsis aphanizomenoides BCCUSP55]|uniref:heterocyst frequency control protein PatD n=1 Tax=Sphaerospermopsis aphanizomenoides TaxID=459663 RepID=UPI000ABED94B|nr:heterocyst frequency control protein PatD [Sphaerospermopsis aphanizomenoides]MBK1989732.1 heterocyst frequency control protein PatD [Sphaerospermopsis aphanizomenoides BCCUSP55]